MYYRRKHYSRGRLIAASFLGLVATTQYIAWSLHYDHQLSGAMLTAKGQTLYWPGEFVFWPCGNLSDSAVWVFIGFFSLPYLLKGFLVWKQSRSIGTYSGRPYASSPYQDSRIIEPTTWKMPGDVQLRTSAASPLSTELDIVKLGGFTARRLMNKTEYRVFRILETVTKQNAFNHRVMAQVSLGEVLASDDDEAFWCVNSKRVDMLVIDTYGAPVIAVEVQGSGHYQGNANMRDAVKKEALEQAGIKFVEVFDGETDADVTAKLRAAFSKPTDGIASE